jgi:GxxExxY protein
MEDYKHTELTGKIIKAAYNVHGELRGGFLEKIYQRAMVKELTEMGILAEAEKGLEVNFRGEVIGQHFVDLLVDSKVVVELKAVDELDSRNEAQILNYLKATGMEVGLLINFGRIVSIKRFVLSSSRR